MACSTNKNYFEDLSALPFGEQLILWSVRLWVQGFKTEQNTNDLLSHGLKLAGVANAYVALDRLMTIIASSATRDVEINCVGSDVITFDEHTLIDAVSFWINENYITAPQFTKLEFLPPAAARCAETYFCDIALSFKAAGHSVRRRKITNSKNYAVKQPGNYLPGSRLLH